METLYQIALLNMAVFFSLIIYRSSSSPVDLTLGFTEFPMNITNFHNHKPYDLPVSERYSFKDGVHKLWVYSTDKHLFPNSTTRPLSEMRIRGYDYSSGVWQFEGQGFVPIGTSWVCIMRTYNDSLLYYRSPVTVPNTWDRWFQLNVIHDVKASNVKIYVDGVQVYEAPGRGGCSHYFKFDVYTQNDPSYYMESRWKGIRVLRKCSRLNFGSLLPRAYVFASLLYNIWLNEVNC